MSFLKIFDGSMILGTQIRTGLVMCRGSGVHEHFINISCLEGKREGGSPLGQLP